MQDREDLNYVIGNMMGSLGESHMYTLGGDLGWKSPPQPTAGLGVEFALNASAERYYLKRIFHGDNTVPGYYAPLAQPGLHEFVRQFYGQITKPGMIIDDRWNLGGFIDTIAC